MDDEAGVAEDEHVNVKSDGIWFISIGVHKHLSGVHMVLYTSTSINTSQNDNV